ncbi:diphthamide biosynthesis protein [Histoplasma ohiense]|nr:diphthamide biosynthesis protein [Histoplasma ohiense (nom. inval.)]
MITTPTHYSILNIPYPPPYRLIKPDLKLAYHRALLQHHPDKARTLPTSTTPQVNGTSNCTNSDSQYINHREAMLAPSVGTKVSMSASTEKLLHPSPPPPNAPPLRYTVDQITTAYKVLSDPASRAEYDCSLRLLGTNSSSYGNGHGDGDGILFRTGMEVFDLDDMHLMGSGIIGSDPGTSFDEKSGEIWYHPCRCGEERGFLVLEEDLEREAERGEVVVGCRGCSLWAKVVFAVDEGDEGDEGGGGEMENEQIP